MATSGFVSAIHALERSKPENTRFQYGSSVCLLSMAAPIAGTCEDATPAMILATFRPRLCAFRSGLRLPGLRALRGLVELARPAAIAFDRTAARQHHGRVII